MVYVKCLNPYTNHFFFNLMPIIHYTVKERLAGSSLAMFNLWLFGLFSCLGFAVFCNMTHWLKLKHLTFIMFSLELDLWDGGRHLLLLLIYSFLLLNVGFLLVQQIVVDSFKWPSMKLVLKSCNNLDIVVDKTMPAELLKTSTAFWTLVRLWDTSMK